MKDRGYSRVEIADELEIAEAELRDLALHVPPRLLTAVRSLIKVCHLQQQEIDRISDLLKDDGR